VPAAQCRQKTRKISPQSAQGVTKALKVFPFSLRLFVSFVLKNFLVSACSSWEVPEQKYCGAESRSSPKFDGFFVAFGGGWEGAGGKPQAPVELANFLGNSEGFLIHHSAFITHHFVLTIFPPPV